MLKKIFICSLIGFSFFPTTNVYPSNGGFLGENNVSEELKGSNKGLVITTRDYIKYILNFLYFIAVVYGIYGGFLILTATSDDDKAKRGKTVMIQTIIGLIVIFLAGPIVSFFLGGTDENGNTINGLLTNTIIQ